jgi:YspA, cpYpsA-related SLOG family
MRILITGSRTWDLYESISTRIVEAIKEYASDKPELQNGPIDWVTIVHGDCPKGADYLADIFATSVLKCDVERYPADWSQGKSAGFRRNRRMVNTMPDICLAFIRDKSKGTTSCRDLAKAQGIATESFYYENEIENYGKKS